MQLITNNIILFHMKTIYLAGGCFWGMEAYYKCLDGILDTEVGYANGNTANPKYEDLKSHTANHAETLKLVYDEKVISLIEILKSYLSVIDPYSVNHQGEDYGEQYRTGVFSIDEKELEEIRLFFKEKEKEYDKGPFAILIEPLKNFYPAEEYHQDYLDKNPHGYCHIKLPKK